MEDRWVLILMSDKPEPVFHRIDRVDRAGYDDWRRVTGCGRVEQEMWWSAYLRREHAESFARACSKCFAGRDQFL